MKKLRNVLLTGLLLLLAPLVALSGVNTWTGSGPFGAVSGNWVVNALAISPNGLTVYAGMGSGTVLSYGYADTTPDAFSFTAQTGVALGATATSNIITVAGVDAGTAISVVGGTYQIGSAGYTSTGGTVSNGNTVTVQQTASGSAGTLTTATLTIGGSSADFNVTTISNQATLTVTAPASVTYGSTGTLTSSGGSGGGAVTYSAGGSTGCSVSGTTLSVTNASNACAVTVSRAADGSYSAATSASYTVTLNKASQSAVTLTSTSGSPGTPLTLSASGGSGTGAYSYAVSNAGTAGCAISGGSTTLTASTAGSCDVIATRSADANYNAASSAATTVTINAAPSKTVTAASPGGSGNITAAFTGGNGSCAYATSQFSTQTPPTGVALTYGVFNFTTNDCGAGSALNFTITYPQNLPTGTRYYKYGPEFGASQSPHWYVLPGAVVSGNQISFTITDNGAGDSNPAAGFITDPGGPGVPAATTVAEPIVPEVPVVPLIPPLTSLPALPGVGNSGRVFLNLGEGAGPVMTGCLRTTLNDLLGADWLYQGQSADGGSRLSRATEIISFYPIEANTNTTYGLGLGSGIYLRTTNPLSVVTGCGTFVTAPALYSLGEFGALLNAGGLTAQINAQGVITYPTGSLTYAVRPSYWVTQGNPGAPALTTGADGLLRFTDSAGHSQILYPAFLDPELLGSQVSQAVGGWTVIQTDGTALVTLWGGQQFVLTPDLALGTVPAGTMTVWWQDGPNHYSFRHSGFSNTGQGFSVTPR
jgi:hypothetical protein